MAANSSWIANVALSNGDSGVCSVASERASSFSRAHSSGSCCCFCAAASAAAVVDRTCACWASCSGLTARTTALLQLSTLLPIGFSALASIFSGDICCAKLALAAAKAGSSAVLVLDLGNQAVVEFAFTRALHRICVCPLFLELETLIIGVFARARRLEAVGCAAAPLSSVSQVQSHSVIFAKL